MQRITQSITQRVRFLSAIGLAASLAGCGSLRIHNEVREKQGTEAKEAWAKVDTAAVIAAERGNLNKLLDTELATQDQLAQAIRDHTLRAIVDAPSIKEGLFDRLDDRLRALVGVDAPTKVSSALDKLSLRRTWEANLAERHETWAQLRTGVSVPSCEDLVQDGSPEAEARRAERVVALSAVPGDGPIQVKNKLIATGMLSELADQCDKEPKDDPFADLRGAYEAARQREQLEKEQAATARQSMQRGATEYRAAAKAYKEALGTDPTSAAASTQAALNRLGKAAEALAKAPDALSRKFISKERLDALNDFVTAVTQASADGKLPPDAKKATVAFVLFPKLVDDARKSLQDAKAPLALPLLIQRNHEQLQLEAATREVAAREAMQRLSGMVAQAIFDQARQMVLARREFDTVAAAAEVKGKSVVDAFKDAKPAGKTSLYRGAALYLDALNRLEARRYKLEYQYIAAEHELQLAYAEVNAKQWSSLIGSTVDQVAAGSAGGIKADSVVALLNTFGVFYIGHGVNQ